MNEALGSSFDEYKRNSDTPINPSHYKKGDIECIDAVEVAIRNLKGPEANSTANVIKYMWRWKDKTELSTLKRLGGT